MRERRPSSGDAPTVGLRDITSQNPRFRLRAADTLGQTPPAHPLRDEAIRALLAALSDPEPLVRYNAALSLTELRAPGLREILEAMLADQHPMARQAAAIGLGELGDPAAVPALEEALREGSPELRFQAVASLWELCHDAAIPQIARALQDEDAEVRAQAASCISDHLRSRAEQGRSSCYCGAKSTTWPPLKR
jgi:HEAT repeat protein